MGPDDPRKTGSADSPVGTGVGRGRDAGPHRDEGTPAADLARPAEVTAAGMAETGSAPAYDEETPAVDVVAFHAADPAMATAGIDQCRIACHVSQRVGRAPRSGQPRRASYFENEAQARSPAAPEQRDYRQDIASGRKLEKQQQAQFDADDHEAGVPDTRKEQLTPLAVCDAKEGKEVLTGRAGRIDNMAWDHDNRVVIINEVKETNWSRYDGAKAPSGPEPDPDTR